MMGRGFSTACLILLAGVLFGLANANSGSPGQNDVQPPKEFGARFPAGIRTHESRTEDLEFPRGVETPVEGEIEIPEPTRSSFMAKWNSAKGAVGFLLDVSTDSSFSSYVDGYHDLDVGNVTGRVVIGLSQGTTYYYRVRPYNATGPRDYSEAMAVTTVATAGLNINATFDSSITGNSNAAAMEAMINRAIAIYESLFSDPVTIQIRFRYATTASDGSPLQQGTVSQSDIAVYTIPWSTFINALRADAKTGNDNLANASLPGSALSANIEPTSANGRAVGLDTPPAMFANGTVGDGGPYDGIVTLNSSVPFQFTRPVSGSNFDAQRSTEHEMDEVIGLRSRLGGQGSDLCPQDLFSWSSAGHRNITSSGTRYFSINGGSTNIVNFNQDPNGDFGDWLSEACPQTHPYVQNAFGCTGQSSDIAATSPEGVNLDVIGYDLVNAPTTGWQLVAIGDFNHNGKPDYVLYNGGTRQTAIWYMNDAVFAGGAYGPTLPAGWRVVGVADFNRDGKPDYLLFNASTRQSAMWYLSGTTFLGGAYGPTLPSGWALVGVGDFNGDGKPDYVLCNESSRQTAIWYLNNNAFAGGAFGPTLPGAWRVVGVADFNRDGKTDYLLFNPGTHQSAIWYLSGVTLVQGAFGPTLPSAWALVGVGDFNGDGKPDYVLCNESSRQTAIWYLNNNVFVGGAYGPTLPGG
jgi:hypothetical protein